MVEEPVSTAQCLEITREIGFDRLLRSTGRPGATTCALRPQADSVKTARDVTRSTLAHWGLAGLGDDAALVVSELVTNAVRYAGHPNGQINGHTDEHPITLMLLRIEPHVLLAVSDPSNEIPIARQPDSVSEHGRGLYIVETYSEGWGWDPLAHGGKAVWALFRADL
jgi:anti-sigma regulatory factor (Ser/Thr protein kinase)